MARTTPQTRAAASLAYVRGHLGLDATDAALPDAACLEAARALRSEIREAECGGGMCHQVSEALETEHGWPRWGVAYLSAEGEVICEAHFVNALPDGTLVDATADQFGEGHDVRVLRPGDPEYGRYRPEFYQDFHPGLSPGAAAWSGDWTGETDMEAAGRLDEERGPGWWVASPDAILAYMERDMAYQAADPRHGARAVEAIAERMDAVRARFAGPTP